MRTILVLLVVFCALIGLSGAYEAFAFAIGFAMILIADCCSRHCFKKSRRQDARYNRWCPARSASDHLSPSKPGRMAEPKPPRRVTVPIVKPGRDRIVPTPSLSKRDAPKPQRSKHPGQDSNLQPAD